MSEPIWIRRTILLANDGYQFGDPDDDDTSMVAIIETLPSCAMSDDGILEAGEELFTAKDVLDGFNTQGFPLPDSVRIVWREP